MSQKKKQAKPIICDFARLSFAMRALHQGNKVYLDSLHDVWKMGAPTPQSRTLLKHYDERVLQAGVSIERIVFPSKLGEWMRLVAKERGIELSALDSDKLISALRKAWG